jgi:G3E family GTPase
MPKGLTALGPKVMTGHGWCIAAHHHHHHHHHHSTIKTYFLIFLFRLFSTAFFTVMPKGLTTLDPKVKRGHGWWITTEFITEKQASESVWES